MAVAPVLERRISFEKEREYEEEMHAPVMTEDERHNSKISANYAKLINPSYTLNDIIEKNKEVEAPKQEIDFTPERVHAQKPYLVENARADADIFRADSAVNRRLINKPVVEEVADEEENEDLRPTAATIKYKTMGVKKGSEEIGKIENSASAKRTLSKKTKIIIAAVVAVVVALFVLIIVNSAIISNVSNDLNALQSSYTDVTETYNFLDGEIKEYKDNFDKIAEFAQNNGMILR
ncbi:MAG: hypothetical protein K2N22_06980 [Clostridia bacterium]|nr:hypothetical protein [Clostridia bacterium]